MGRNQYDYPHYNQIRFEDHSYRNMHRNRSFHRMFENSDRD
jgi:hypothetical protein